MQLPARNIHVGRSGRTVQLRKLSAQLFRVMRLNTGFRTFQVEGFQAFVNKQLDGHLLSVTLRYTESKSVNLRKHIRQNRKRSALRCHATEEAKFVAT